ncbi:MAG: hypothetical protein WCC06_00815 [Candidatus Aminicenantales bacterium]
MRISNGHKFLVLWFMLGIALAPQSAAQGQPERPPEYKEFMKALKIEDLNMRIKELERIKAAFPNTALYLNIEKALLSARIELCETLDCVLALQKPQLETANGFNGIYLYYVSANNILEHKNIKKFDKTAVTQAVRDYIEKSLKIANGPDFYKSFTPGQQDSIKSFLLVFHILEARAYLNEENPERSMKALDTYRDSGGESDRAFYYTMGETYVQLGKAKEAFECYFEAASENYKDSVEKAMALYRKLYGPPEEFSAKLEAKQRELPFHPEPFQPAGEWKGKVVLAEIFTGSECPPCVAADLGFDGLIEAFGRKFAAILEYHLPIPGPDPMMNPATKKRQEYYRVNSTPTPFFDGEKIAGGGGDRPAAEVKFHEYSSEIESRIYEMPKVQLKASAIRNKENIQIEYHLDKVIDNADYNIALVQKEEKFLGHNGILFHKMVVREFMTIDPRSDSRQAVINLARAEKAAEKYLADFELERLFLFKEKRFRIDRSGLCVVFFVQDRETQKVYNAVVTDVK